jgi:hypothetical protein
LRGETAEDRLIEHVRNENDEKESFNLDSETHHIASVHQFPRIIKNKIPELSLGKTVSAEDVAKTNAKDSIFVTRKKIVVREFD